MNPLTLEQLQLFSSSLGLSNTTDGGQSEIGGNGNLNLNATPIASNHGSESGAPAPTDAGGLSSMLEQQRALLLGQQILAGNQGNGMSGLNLNFPVNLAAMNQLLNLQGFNGNAASLLMGLQLQQGQNNQQQHQQQQQQQQQLLAAGAAALQNALLQNAPAARAGAVTFSASASNKSALVSTSSSKDRPHKAGKSANPRRRKAPPNSVPCRCRGLPPDHNPETAYIVIPENIGHGQALKCSHPICRNRGARFRFCAACERPVAKRNFSTRHSHPNHDFARNNNNNNNKMPQTTTRPMVGAPAVSEAETSISGAMSEAGATSTTGTSGSENGANSSSSENGGTTSDTGTSEQDTRTSEQDTGSSENDAGSSEQDSGGSENDAAGSENGCNTSDTTGSDNGGSDAGGSENGDDPMSHDGED